MTCQELRAVDRLLEGMTLAEIGAALNHLADCPACKRWVREHGPRATPVQEEQFRQTRDRLIEDPEALSEKALELLGAKRRGHDPHSR